MKIKLLKEKMQSQDDYAQKETRVQLDDIKTFPPLKM